MWPMPLRERATAGFWGSAGRRVARASRVLVSASRRNNLKKSANRDGFANTRDACATRNKKILGPLDELSR